MRIAFTFVVIFGLISTGIGCSSRKNLDLDLIAGKPFLLPLSAVRKDMVATHRVTVELGDQSESYLVRLELSSRKFVIVGYTLLGAPLFVVYYRNKNLSVEKTPIMSGLIPPDQLFADYQLIYWPIDTIRQHFHNTGVSVHESTGGPFCRYLTDGGTVILKIYYEFDGTQSKRVIFDHLVENYRLVIQSAIE